MSLEDLRAEAEREESEVNDVVEIEETVQEAEVSDTEAIEPTEESEEFELELEDEPAPQEQKYTAEQAILHKLKKSKTKVKEISTENDELKQQLDTLTKTVEALQSPATPQPVQQQVQAEAFPDLWDKGIDGDRDKHNQAVQTYMSKQAQIQHEQAQQAQQQSTLAAQVHDQQVRLASKVAKFATDNKVGADKAAEAVSLAMSEIDAAYGQEGALQYLLDNLEGDSAKVAYLLGTNTAAREKIKQAVATDKTGMKAGMLLAQYEVKAKSKRKVSGAPEPDQALKGDALNGVVDSTLQKQYDEETDYMKLRVIRDRAKELGVVLK
jgi:hypothetical protein